MSTQAALAAQERMTRPCVYCGQLMRPANIATHEPACSPEAREARKARVRFFAKRYRDRTKPQRAAIFRGWSIPDRYESRPGDMDTCPDCGGPKTKHGARCIACHRALVGRPSRPLAERFWEKVDRSGGTDACWPWIGAIGVHGYGRVNLDGRSTGIASRVAWTLTFGDPGDLGVLHRCDNPPCCNPAHLFLGTQLDNSRDMVAKGRAAWQRAS